MWEGIPKDAGCWEGWRIFLCLFNQDISIRGETDEAKSMASNPTSDLQPSKKVGFLLGF